MDKTSGKVKQISVWVLMQNSKLYQGVLRGEQEFLCWRRGSVFGWE